MINIKKHKKRANEVIFISLILVSLFVFSSTIFFTSCNNNTNYSRSDNDTVCDVSIDNTTYTDACKEVNIDSKDSIFIGDIMMGCTKSEFNKEFKSFLSKNETLNGLKIQQHKAFFVNGKLVRLILFSEPHIILPPDIAGTFSNSDSQMWRPLYEKKYNQECEKSHKFMVEGTIIRKQFVTIEVFDRIHTKNPPTTYLYDLNPNHNEYIDKEDIKAMECLRDIQKEEMARNSNFTYIDTKRKYHSMIDIYDRLFIESEKERLKKEYENHENQLKNNNMNAI